MVEDAAKTFHIGIKTMRIINRFIDVRTAEALASFRRRLKAHLFRVQWVNLVMISGWR